MANEFPCQISDCKVAPTGPFAALADLISKRLTCAACGKTFVRGDNESWAIESNSNVITLDVETTLDLPLDRILDGARKADLSDALVLGYQGDDFFMSSMTCDAGKILVLLERARRLLMTRLP